MSDITRNSSKVPIRVGYVKDIETNILCHNWAAKRQVLLEKFLLCYSPRPFGVHVDLQKMIRQDNAYL